MIDPALVRALVRWQHAAGPFWPYVCATPFLAGAGGTMTLEHEAPLTRPIGVRVHRPMLDQLLAALALPTRGRPGVLVDLPIEATLTTAPALAERGWYVVPVVQRWMARPAVLPCGRLLERLLAVGARVRPPAEPRGVVLLADGERSGRPGPVRGRAFDNRYGYQICRFPPPSLLATFGVETVRWLTPSRIAPDLTAYADTLVAAGLRVETLPTFAAGS